MSAYARQKAKSKYINRIPLERASQKQSSGTHKTPYDRVKRCQELVESGNIWAALNIEVLRADECEMSNAGMQGRGKREITEKTRRRAVSSSTIPKCENPEANPPLIEPGSPRGKAISLTTTPPRPQSQLSFRGEGLCTSQGPRRTPGLAVPLEGFRCSCVLFALSPSSLPHSLYTTPAILLHGPRPRRTQHDGPSVWYSNIGKITEVHCILGATVAERLACSPPTKEIRVHSPAGSPDFLMWESCRTMPFVGGFFSWISRFPRPLNPAPLHSHAYTRVSLGWGWCDTARSVRRGMPLSLSMERWSSAHRALCDLNIDLSNLHFHQDGATAHTARLSVDTLRTMLQQRITSRFGDIPWPAHSPRSVGLRSCPVGIPQNPLFQRTLIQRCGWRLVYFRTCDLDARNRKRARTSRETLTCTQIAIATHSDLPYRVVPWRKRTEVHFMFKRPLVQDSAFLLNHGRITGSLGDISDQWRGGVVTSQTDDVHSISRVSFTCSARQLLLLGRLLLTYHLPHRLYAQGGRLACGLRRRLAGIGETAAHATNYSPIRNQNDTPASFANQRLVSYSPTSTPANREPFVAFNSQSDSRPFP
ncbi:hypothetical protein PR048_022028 [Dryococelus australis]|uniref:Uncharacterized protein n=1 Tax=Dryococelus australis TaxID=614101 RepID=A0ABQ9GZW0_9NEOP|nr:hypothetical protein PR048_022028 [Dryococelus australis]